MSPRWLSEFETGKAPGGAGCVLRLLDALDVSVAFHERRRAPADQILRAALDPFADAVGRVLDEHAPGHAKR